VSATAGWAWLDGRLVPAGEARLCVLDRGLQYGDGVFETLRAEAGRVFFLGPHLARMRRGLDALGIRAEGAEALAREGLAEVLSALPRGTPSVLKAIVTRGAGPQGPAPEGAFAPTVLVLGREDAAPRPEAMSAIVSSFRRNERSPLARIKSLNYLEMVLARAEAARSGADEAVLLNTSGRVAEASAANVFAVVSGRVVTPGEDEGCLPGIARAKVLELAPRLGIEAAETPVSLEELRGASEVFLTNSRIGVVPLRSLEGRPVGARAPGEFTARLREAFRESELASGEEP